MDGPGQEPNRVQGREGPADCEPKRHLIDCEGSSTLQAWRLIGIPGSVGPDSHSDLIGLGYDQEIFDLLFVLF